MKTSPVKVGKNLPEIDGFMVEIDAALKREKDWRKNARNIVKIYESDDEDKYPFNILFSNTETMAPALYNMTPRPQVKRKFHDPDPIGKAGTQVLQRTLEYLLDNDLGDFASFDEVMPDVVLDALVPGRGIPWYEYQASMLKEPAEKAEPQEDGETVEELDEEAEAEDTETLEYELITTNHVPWDRIIHGYAKKWKDVGWIAREHFMDAEELKENFGDKAAGVPMTVVATDACSDEGEPKEEGDGGDPTLAHVWELWDKTSRRVLFFAPAKRDKYLRDVPDPLGLTGFFPTTGPLHFYRSTSSLVPIPLYNAYKNQAEELNQLTKRINKIIRAMKIRGFYDSTVEGLSELLSSEDNTLLPANNVAAMQQTGGLEKAIWLMPIEKLINVLQQLYVQRTQVKAIIYEITGVSDILRGASAASESATAQNIKNQWGTLRLKRSQKLVQVAARDGMRIMAEMACKKFSVETFKAMTGLSYPTREEKAQGQQVMQQLQQQMQGMQAVAQIQGQEPPEPPPQVQQEMQQIQEMMAVPAWEDILEMLNTDLQRSYKIDIETNSTVDAEATEDQEHMGEFLNAVAQFLNGVGPMVEQGILPFEAAKSMLLAVTRRYKFGPEVEEELEKMAAPKPPEDDGAKAAEAQAKQLELQGKQAEMEGKKQLLQLEVQAKGMEAQIRGQELQQEGSYKAALHQQQMQELQQRQIASAAEHQRKMESIRAQRELNLSKGNTQK